MPCEDEHDHSHDHGHHGHSHEVPLESGPNDSLYAVIDTPNVVALNAKDGAEAGQRVIKWADSALGVQNWY